MKKKNLISMIVALSLTASVMVGATLAYLTAQTEEVTNTFTVGNVDIELTEPNWDSDKAKDLEPGAVVEKDPTVTNTGINDAYVALTVDGMEEMSATGFSAVVNAGWVKVDAAGVVDTDWNADERVLEDGIYAYNDVLTKDGLTSATTPLFGSVAFGGLSSATVYTIEGIAVDPEDESKGKYYIIKDADDVQVGTDTFATETAAKNYIDSNLTDTTVTSFDLVVKAFAIQTKGFENAAAYAWVDEIDFTK